MYLFRIFLSLMVVSTSYSLDIAKKYPSYQYIFNEFDIDKSYLQDSDFKSFVKKNERNLILFYKKSLKRGKKILPTMKGLLTGEGVSDLFIYLSMIESGFSTHIVSSKKAVGLWQFMPATAKQYNLQICNEYDERCDTVSATSAAINYLNKLHRQFGKWYLAAMAYNCGEGCVERAIKKAGTDDISILTDNRLRFLPRETRDYIRKILLVAMIGENKIFLRVNSADKYKKDRVKVKVLAGTKLEDVATAIKMKYADLIQLNQHVADLIESEDVKKVTITIPIEKVYAFYLRYDLLDKSIPVKNYLISHFVIMGDSLTTIALKYETTEKELMLANHLSEEYLTLGDILVIPVTKEIFDINMKSISPL